MEELDHQPEAVKLRLQKFTEETGWKVDPNPILCWHKAVGRKCPHSKTWAQCREQIRVSLSECGLADHWYTNPLDHPRRATTPDGEHVMLCSPYVLDQRGATALTKWCEERELIWTAVPAGWYWPGVTLSVIIRNTDKEPLNWVPDPIRWKRYGR